jgi:hypothetical protein
LSGGSFCLCMISNVANLNEVVLQVIMGGVLGVVCAKFMESPEVLAKIRKFQQVLSNGDSADPVKEQRPFIEVSSYTFKKSSEEHTCIICYDSVNVDEQATDCSSCARTFHHNCLSTWVNTGCAKCPLCRNSWNCAQAVADEPVPMAIPLRN